MSENFTDIAIIGAGPVGLFAIFEAGMLKMRCHVIDALDFVGGQCTALYPEKPIYDIPAHPSIDGADLIDKLMQQAAPFSPTFHLGQVVEELVKTKNGFTITTSTGTIINAKAVVIAAGCGAFGPNRPPLEGIEQYENTSIFYMVSKKESMRGKRIAIAGGGDSAIDWALSLAPIAEHIYLIHRRAKFKCAPESFERIKQFSNIEFVVPYQLDSLIGNDGQISELIVKDLDDNKKSLNIDVLLPFFGLSMQLGPIANWGLGLHKHHIEVSPVTLETNIAGIHAIGDIVTYPGKLKLILNGFAEAAMAVHAIYPKIYPDTALHFEYSTTKGIKIDEYN